MKTKTLNELKKLQRDFMAKKQNNAYFSISELLRMDFIPNDMDIYEVNVSSQSTSIINGWKSHIENNKYYSFFVEFTKVVNNKVVSEYVNIDLQDVDLLVELYEILKGE